MCMSTDSTVFLSGDISKQFSDADEVQAELAKVKFS